MALIATLVVGLLVCMAVGGRAAQLLFGTLAMLLPVALMALGVLRQGRLGVAGVALTVLALLLVGGYFAMVGLVGRVAQGPWVAGLPLASVVFLATVWLLPLVLVSLAYALTFDAQGVSDESLRQLRSLAPERIRREEGG